MSKSMKCIVLGALLCAGSCGSSSSSTEGCPSSQVECGGFCVDLTTSREHCGACDNACDPGTVCSAAACRLTCGGTTPTMCSGGCFDLDTSTIHCGACGNSCAPGLSCTSGLCTS